MTHPQLSNIDHIHVYVDDRAEAERWYAEVLGFRRVEKFMVWATEGGPLTLEDPGGSIHLAVFERPEHVDTSAIAFGASGAQFLAWKSHLEKHGLKLRVSDHDLAFSLYFKDPHRNLHEITTYDHAFVRERLQPRSGVK